MSLEYYSEFKDEPAELPNEPAIDLRLAEFKAGGTSALEQDVNRLMPQVEWQLKELLEPNNDHEGLIHYTNTACNPLNPTFIEYVQLKNMGYAVRLEQLAHDAFGNELPNSHMAVYGDPVARQEINQLFDPMRPFGNDPAPYDRLTSDLRVNMLRSVYILNDGASRKTHSEKWKEVVPDVIDKHGEWNKEAAAALYRRGFMTQVLLKHLDIRRDGDDAEAMARKYGYIEDWRVYDALRARGEHPLGFEEMHGIVSSQLKFALQKTDIVPPIDRKE